MIEVLAADDDFNALEIRVRPENLFQRFVKVLLNQGVFGAEVVFPVGAPGQGAANLRMCLEHGVVFGEFRPDTKMRMGIQPRIGSGFRSVGQGRHLPRHAPHRQLRNRFRCRKRIQFTTANANSIAPQEHDLVIARHTP